MQPKRMRPCEQFQVGQFGQPGGDRGGFWGRISLLRREISRGPPTKVELNPLPGMASVLKIERGYKEYSLVVPEQCEIVITRLTVPGESSQLVLDQLKALVDSLHLASKVDIQLVPPSYDPYFLDPKAPIVPCFNRAYEQALGRLPCYAPHRGITDANVFTTEGDISTLLFGPKGANHHLAGEYVELSTLEPAVRVYIETAVRFLGN